MELVAGSLLLRVSSGDPETALRLSELVGSGQQATACRLVVSISIGILGAYQHHAASAAYARGLSLPWLHISCEQDAFITLGPLFAANEPSPCFDCCLRVLNAFPQKAGSLNGSLLHVVLGIISVEINRFACLDLDSNMSSVRIYDLATHSTKRRMVARVPGCLACWPWRPGSEPQDSSQLSVTALFEECSRAQGRLPAGRSRKRKKSVLLNEKSFPHCVKVQLDSWKDLYEGARLRKEEGSSPCTEKLSRVDVANLLFLAFGRFPLCDEVHADRTLPSAGNLGSPEAFLIAQDVSGLSAGIYYYEKASHQLAFLETPYNTKTSELMVACGAGSHVDVPNAFLVIVGAHGRIAAKYGAFGFRLAHFDAGVALEGIHEVAASMGVSVTEMARWNDAELEKNLLLRPFAETIMCVAALYSPRRNTGVQRIHSQLEKQAECVSMTADLTPVLMARLIFDRSRGGHDEQITSGKENKGPLLPLATIWQRATRRTSQRRFADRTVNQPLAEEVLSIANADEALTSVRVALYSQGPPATRCILSYSADGGRLAWQSVADAEDSSRMFVDEDLSAAPLAFWICGNVQCSAARYRKLLVEAGQVAFRLMRAADSVGLTGVIYAGIRPSVAGTVLGIRYVDETPLLAFVAGFEP